MQKLIQTVRAMWPMWALTLAGCAVHLALQHSGYNVQLDTLPYPQQQVTNAR